MVNGNGENKPRINIAVPGKGGKIRQRLEDLAELPALKKSKQLLDDPMSRALVRAMPSEELHFLVRETGGNEARELIALASPGQVNEMLDLELWHKEYFNEKNFKEWLETLLSISTRKAVSVLLDMDTEILVLFFKRVIRAVRRQEDEDPLEFISEERYSPDNLYFIEFISNLFPREMIEPILDHLYGYDQEKFVSLMDHILTNIESQLEEDAYRFRKGRLEDRGFPDYYESQELFEFRDPDAILKTGAPKKVYHDEKIPPSGYLTTLLRPESFLAGALSEKAKGGIDDDLKWEAAYICHQVMAAEGIDFSDMVQTRGAVAVSHGYINIGLKYLAGSDSEKAVELLDRLYLKQIFQAGFSLTLKLKQKMKELLSHWDLMRKDGGVYLFDPEYTAVFTGLNLIRPMYRRLGGGNTAIPYRAFVRLEEVEELNAIIDRASAICFFFFDHLNFKLSDFFRMDFGNCLPSDRREVYFSHLFLTAVCRRILGLPPTFDPIDVAQLRDLHKASVEPEPEPQMKPAVRDELKNWLRETLPENDFSYIWTFATDCIEIFNNNFAPVNPETGIDPKFIKGLIVKIRD
jgi:hypothetical protein